MFVQASRDDGGDVCTDDYIGDCRAVRRDIYRDNYSAAFAVDVSVFTQILEARNLGGSGVPIVKK
jgi:hypothetical protein